MFGQESSSGLLLSTEISVDQTTIFFFPQNLTYGLCQQTKNADRKSSNVKYTYCM